MLIYRVPGLYDEIEGVRKEYLGNKAEISDIDKLVTKWLAACPADTYLFVNQPGVTLEDFQVYTTPEGFNLWSELRKLIGRVGTIGSFARINERPDYNDYIEFLFKHCGVEHINVVPGEDLFERYADDRPRVITVKFPDPGENSIERSKALAANDRLLLDIMERTPSTSYAVIYQSSTGEEFEDSPEFRKKRYMEIFPDIVRLKHSSKERQGYEKQGIREHKTKASNEPISRLPPKAQLDRVKEKKKSISSHKDMQYGGQWQNFIQSASDMIDEKVLLCVATIFLVPLLFLSGRSTST